MSQRTVNLAELHQYLSLAQDRLSEERLAIARMLPFDEGFNPEAYVEAYRYAERLVLKKVRHQLDEVAWLPIQLDPDTEVRLRVPEMMEKWRGSQPDKQPGAYDFGNDFVHAATRAALLFGWDDLRTVRLVARIGSLFVQLSYLVAIVFFTSFMSESGIDEIPLTDPTNLSLSAREFSSFVRKACAPHILAPAPEQGQLDPFAGKNKPPYLHLVSETEPPPAT